MQETEILVDLLKADRRPGHFLDVGAFDGALFSSTSRLVELGWSGVCIEQTPSMFIELLGRYGTNKHLAIINSTITPENGFVSFQDASGIRFIVYTVTFTDLFSRFGTVFDFISLKGTGDCVALFASLPLQTLAQCRVLSIEHDSKLAEIKQRAEKFGFNYVWHSTEKVLLSRA